MTNKEALYAIVNQTDVYHASGDSNAKCKLIDYSICLRPDKGTECAAGVVNENYEYMSLPITELTFADEPNSVLDTPAPYWDSANISVQDMLEVMKAQRPISVYVSGVEYPCAYISQIKICKPRQSSEKPYYALVCKSKTASSTIQVSPANISLAD